MVIFSSFYYKLKKTSGKVLRITPLKYQLEFTIKKSIYRHEKKINHILDIPHYPQNLKFILLKKKRHTQHIFSYLLYFKEILNL